VQAACFVELVLEATRALIANVATVGDAGHVDGLITFEGTGFFLRWRFFKRGEPLPFPTKSLLGTTRP
jgi:hypothetical protein